MNCEQVGDRLADHVLVEPDPEVARHLRGCGGCRAEAAALEQGVAAFVASIPEAEPPARLKGSVLASLSEEWEAVGSGSMPSPEASAVGRAGGTSAWSRPARWLAAAAVVLLFAGSLAWGAAQWRSAGSNRDAADRYRRFLATLGGRSLREGALVATGSVPVDGSAVMYDSMEGQSWVLVVADMPGADSARVTISSPQDTIQLPPLEVSSDGHAYGVFVTSEDISAFDRVEITSPDGAPMATARIGG